MTNNVFARVAARGMALLVVLSVMVAVSSSEAAPQTTGERCRPMCPLLYAPICASDGAGTKSFDNQCLLEVHNCQMRNAGKPTLTVVANGPCQ
ncbi:extracellular protease inhibitor 10-like [Ischnura elegans]|uniref:extracellular protease inhibitor 10-like n=1 Tax=Ischnura elegans TaxID=197161 RepID=UPI001ED8992F|nr:extracellular protease inhibitor 10-like [Ischnura elegans]